DNTYNQMFKKWSEA
ncbi:hypothetical protein I5B89_13015, partial [Staphylococcus aureus]|nr:hypothetical protein [Staphylococcus aureus]HDD6872659.1 hypothetical protein [Staphylococcus aureus]HDK3299137.1 hypothetical protein [Staphylococcus aureus]HEK6524620.1 hypothetical protein [Staphylococcus aureus]